MANKLPLGYRLLTNGYWWKVEYSILRSFLWWNWIEWHSLGSNRKTKGEAIIDAIEDKELDKPARSSWKVVKTEE